MIHEMDALLGSPAIQPQLYTCMEKTCAYTGPYVDFRPVRGGRVAKRCSWCREIERDRVHRARATKSEANEKWKLYQASSSIALEISDPAIPLP